MSTKQMARQMVKMDRETERDTLHKSRETIKNYIKVNTNAKGIRKMALMIDKRDFDAGAGNLKKTLPKAARKNEKVPVDALIDGLNRCNPGLNKQDLKTLPEADVRKVSQLATNRNPKEDRPDHENRDWDDYVDNFEADHNTHAPGRSVLNDLNVAGVGAMGLDWTANGFWLKTAQKVITRNYDKGAVPVVRNLLGTVPAAMIVDKAWSFEEASAFWMNQNGGETRTNLKELFENPQK